MLSGRLGKVMSFVIETASGVASLRAFDGGQLSWQIDTLDGVIRTRDDRPPEAASLPEDAFYMDEIEQLQRAFGLTPFEDLPGDLPTLGRAYIDRTDHSARRAARAAAARSSPHRPWWKLW